MGAGTDVFIIVFCSGVIAYILLAGRASCRSACVWAVFVI